MTNQPFSIRQETKGEQRLRQWGLLFKGMTLPLTVPFTVLGAILRLVGLMAPKEVKEDNDMRTATMKFSDGFHKLAGAGFTLFIVYMIIYGG